MAPPAQWGGTSAWPAPAGNAAAAAPPTLELPLAAAPVGAASPASLAAFAAEGGLWGPLLPRLQACLVACVAKATLATTGSLGGSAFESVAPPSIDLLMSLPPPLETARIPAAGLHSALGGRAGQMGVNARGTDAAHAAAAGDGGTPGGGALHVGAAVARGTRALGRLRWPRLRAVAEPAATRRPAGRRHEGR